jgi:K+-sensing histidine kinase KdpD
MLAELNSGRPGERRGRLEIFFGASVGVGKTYAMLESARGALAAGVDVVVGYVETHGRIETERLVGDLERLKALDVCYRRIIRYEFDLDAALARAPAVLLVDELAHSNVGDGEPEQRHSKRWQDIEELLAAGINVWLARDRFLIAVAPDDQAEQLIRVGKRFADALDAEWLVVSVETPAMLKLGEQARNRRIRALRLAESLGAQTVTLEGSSASAALTEYARLRHVTRIVVGEPRRFGIRALIRPSTATKIVRAGGGFDLSVIARREPPQKERAAEEVAGSGNIHWGRYWAAFATSLTCRATTLPETGSWP